MTEPDENKTPAVVKKDDLAIRLPKPMNPGATLVAKEVGRTFAALPPSVDVENFAHACVIAANELEKDCWPVSVMNSALNCAKMGLMPGKAMGLAYFVPFKNRDKSRYEAQLIVGYKGMIDLAYATGFMKSIHCDLVLKGESFEQWNDELGPHFKHPKPLDRDDPTRKNIVGAYCWGDLMTGGRFFQYVSIKSINDSYNDYSPAWKYHFDEMAMKTAIRRASKKWKQHGRMGLAVHLDEMAERNVIVHDVDPDDATKPRDTLRDLSRDAKPAADDKPEVIDAEPTEPSRPAEEPKSPGPLTGDDLDSVLGGD